MVRRAIASLFLALWAADVAQALPGAAINATDAAAFAQELNALAISLKSDFAELKGLLEAECERRPTNATGGGCEAESIGVGHVSVLREHERELRALAELVRGDNDVLLFAAVRRKRELSIGGFIQSTVKQTVQYGRAVVDTVASIVPIEVTNEGCSLSSCRICVKAPIVADPKRCIDPVETLRYVWETAIGALKAAVRAAARTVESMFESALRLLTIIFDSIESLFGEVLQMAERIGELIAGLGTLVADLSKGAFSGIMSIKDEIMEITSFVRKMLPTSDAVKKLMDLAASSAFAALNSCVDVGDCFGVEDSYELYSHDFDVDGTKDLVVSVDAIRAQVCLTEFKFVLDDAALDALLFEKLLSNNYYVEFLNQLGGELDEFLGAGKDLVRGTIQAVKDIVGSMRVPLENVKGSFDSVKGSLENALGALRPDMLSFIPDTSPERIKQVMENLVPNVDFGGRRLTEAEAEELTTLFMRHRTLKLFRGLNEREQHHLHDRVAAKYPENHRRMLLSFDGAWLKEVFAAIPGIRLRLAVSAGYELNVLALQAFETSGDILDLEAIRRRVGDAIPLEKEAEILLPFPGLRAKFRINLDIRMPWSIYAEANADAKIAFEYDREFEVEISTNPSARELSGGVQRVTPSFGADAQIHAAVGLRLHSLGASAQLCFFHFCGGMFLESKMDLFWAGFDAWASQDAVPTGNDLANPFSNYVYQVLDPAPAPGRFFSAAHFVVAKPVIHVFLGLDVQLMCVADIDAATTLFETDWGDDPYFGAWQFSIAAGAAPPGEAAFDASSPAPDFTDRSLWYSPVESALCPLESAPSEFAQTCGSIGDYAQYKVRDCFNEFCNHETGEFTEPECDNAATRVCRGCYERSKCGILVEDVKASIPVVDRTKTTYDAADRVLTQSECTFETIAICSEYSFCFSIGCLKNGTFDTDTVPYCEALLSEKEFCLPCFPHSGCGRDKLTFPAVITSTYDDVDAGVVDPMTDYCPQALFDAGCKYAGKCYGDGESRAGCGEDGKTLASTGFYASCATPLMGAQCAGCFPDSSCTYTEEELGWITKVDVEREFCTDAAYERCLTDSYFCFTRACKPDGVMIEDGAYAVCSNYVGIGSLCSECFPDSPCGSHFALTGGTGNWRLNDAPTPVDFCNAEKAEACKFAADCFFEGCLPDGKTIRIDGKWENCKLAVECQTCFPTSPCAYTMEDVQKGIAVQTYKVDVRTGADTTEDGGSCPQELFDQCSPYGTMCYGKACSKTEFEMDLHGEDEEQLGDGGYSLSPPHYPFKEGGGYRKTIWKESIYQACLDIPEACRNCFPNSPCGGDPFKVQESFATCPSQLLEAGCKYLGRCFFEGCDAVTGQFKSDVPWDECQYAPVCAGCKFEGWIGSFPQSACSATAEETLAGTAVLDETLCPAEIHDEGTSLSCEMLGACFSQMSRPENEDGLRFPSLDLFDPCREKAIACVGCFPNAATKVPRPNSGLTIDSYFIEKRGNGLVGPQLKEGVITPTSLNDFESFDNTFCWDIEPEKKVDRCEGYGTNDEDLCWQNGGEWKSAEFSLRDHCQYGAKCVMDGCDADGVWNTDPDSIFAPCTVAPICVGCFPEANEKCRLKEEDKSELVSLWYDYKEEDFCGLNSECMMYAVCMTLACPADGESWESLMVGPYEGCKDLLPTSDATFESGPLGPKPYPYDDAGQQRFSDLKFKRQVCAACFPNSPCSPQDVCFNDYDGSFIYQDEEQFPGHPGRISCFTDNAARYNPLTFPNTESGVPLQCDPFKWVWVGDPGTTCEALEEWLGQENKGCNEDNGDPNNADTYADLIGTNGKTSGQACCICGGGSRPSVAGRPTTDIYARYMVEAETNRRRLLSRRHRGRTLLDIPSSLKNAIDTVGGGVMSSVNNIGNKLKSMGDLVKSGLGRASNTWQDFAKQVADVAVEPVTKGISDFVGVNGFINGATTAAQEMRDLNPEAPFTAMKNAIGSAVSLITDNFERLVRELFTGLLPTAGDFLKSIRDKILGSIVSIGEDGLCIDVSECVVDAIVGERIAIYDVPRFGKVEITSLSFPKVCLAGFDFGMDIACIGTWFLTLLTDNAFVDTMLGMAETIVTNLWKASGLPADAFQRLTQPGKLIDDATGLLNRVSSKVADELARLKEMILGVVGGRRLQDLGESEAHIVHMHRILTNDDHRERLGMLIGLQKLDEAASVVFPEHFDAAHRNALGAHMRKLTDRSSMSELMQCFEDISITYTLDWGYELSLSSTERFAVEQDLMELEEVRKFVGDMIPFHKVATVPLGLPGLFLNFEVFLDVESPLGVQVSAGVEQTVSISYSEMLTVSFAKGGKPSIETTNAHPSIDIPSPSTSLSISGYSGVKLSRADVSLGICFGLAGGKGSAASMCASLHAKTTTNILNLGFDLRTLSQTQLSQRVPMRNPMFTEYEGYDFGECSSLIGSNKPDVVALGTFFTIDKPKITVSYELPKLPGAGCVHDIAEGAILFQALWENNPHVFNANKVKCSSQGNLAVLDVVDAFGRTDPANRMPVLKSRIKMILALPDATLSEDDEQKIQDTLGDVLRSKLIRIVSVSVTQGVTRRSRRLQAEVYTVEIDFKAEFDGIGRLKTAQSAISRDAESQSKLVAASLLEKGFDSAVVDVIEEMGLESSSGDSLSVEVETTAEPTIEPTIQPTPSPTQPTPNPVPVSGGNGGPSGDGTNDGGSPPVSTPTTAPTIRDDSDANDDGPAPVSAPVADDSGGSEEPEGISAISAGPGRQKQADNVVATSLGLLVMMVYYWSDCAM